MNRRNAFFPPVSHKETVFTKLCSRSVHVYQAGPLSVEKNPIHASFMSPAGPLPLSTDALRLIAFRALFGIRNGALYGLKVRAPHSLVTTGALYMFFFV